MDQTELTGLLADGRGKYSWFLGAGTSLSAGLPTANDIVWDIKRRHYGRAEIGLSSATIFRTQRLGEKIE